MVTARVTGVGTALPPAFDQEEVWEGYFRAHFGGSRVAERIFRGSGVDRRHAVVSPLDEDLSGESTGVRMLRYEEHAPALGHAAVTAALASAGLTTADVGQLTIASCTGYTAPGLDVRLAASLDLPVDARRLLVGHMGCYAALPALAATTDYVVAHRRPAVLLCVELTSLHLQPPTADPSQVVSHALFSDAAAAIVLQPGDEPGGGLEVLGTTTLTDTTAQDHMTWRVTDLGFRMELSPRVPDVLGKHVRPAVEDLLGGYGLVPSDVRGWAVHPGGPRILDTTEQELDLSADALAHSRRVLREHGNCSSATVLLVLDELLARGGLRPGDPVVAMAFGPGLTLCAALLRVT
ncbi:type III polyketide synthase [Saccharothrix longispora]|uniref:Naringenin-chalcone synthase n=1 Tax=Saccharothrix longispora TaxID=33920 RepID=A0ABU1PTV5_9PSEU|nr:type III polyketide synthase [Saccharothrix longispora]MDR6594026.1 putative naringenin-chalcone synthase [Saccharothrix longispora]